MTGSPKKPNTFFGLQIGQFNQIWWKYRRLISKRILLLEFKKQQLVLAQARLTDNSIKIDKIQKIELPDDAIERGVPSDPQIMSSLITNLCQENNIYARRCAVVLPTDSAFTKLVYLPKNLDLEEARSYANSPSSGFQIPIPLDQSDFDLSPTSLPTKLISNEEQSSYFLTSVPKKLTDKLIETLKLSDLELISMNVAFISQLSFIFNDINELRTNEFIINIELLNDNSHFTIITSSGPIATERISAIREFPANILSNKDSLDISLNDINAEEITYKDDNYLPISSLDIQSLLSDSQLILKSYKDIMPNFKLKKIFLSGVNSAHKDIDKVISSRLRKDVEIIRPTSSRYLSKLDFLDLFVYQSLNRLFSIPIGLMIDRQSVTKDFVSDKDDLTYLQDGNELRRSNKVLQVELNKSVSNISLGDKYSIKSGNKSVLPKTDNGINLDSKDNSDNINPSQSASKTPESETVGEISKSSINKEDNKINLGKENTSSSDIEDSSKKLKDKKNDDTNSSLGVLKFSDQDD